MKHRSWKDHKLYICELIRHISDHYGGDDLNLLREYAKFIVDEHKHDFSMAIACFEDLKSQLAYMPRIVLHGTKC